MNGLTVLCCLGASSGKSQNYTSESPARMPSWGNSVQCVMQRFIKCIKTAQS